MIILATVPATPQMMPMTIPDIWWVISTVVMLILLSIVVVFLKRLLASIDAMRGDIVNLLVDQTATSTELSDHLKNDGMHCKNMVCKS